MKIKIISGWSDTGGSTIAHINMCKEFIKAGYDAEFYGPHEWHLHKELFWPKSLFIRHKMN